jgi:uridine kinase
MGQAYDEIELCIGVAGGSASGKSTFVKALVDQLPAGQVIVIGLDSYYHANTHRSPSERAALNYDHPNAFEIGLLVGHIRSLRAGQEVTVPRYDYTIHDRVPGGAVKPNRYVIVEGILALHYPDLRRSFDATMFIDAPRGLRLERRLSRDVQDRGRTEESVRLQWESQVIPAEDTFCIPSRAYADVVLDSQRSLDEIVAAGARFILGRSEPSRRPGVTVSSILP